MSLIKIANDRLKQEFDNAKVKGAHQFAPRDGYYFIKDVYYKFIGKSEVPVATANWKPTLEQAFLTEVTFEIALLGIRKAEEPNSVVCYPGLVGLTIQILDSMIVNINDNGIMKPLFTCKYIVLAIESVFWSNMDLLRLSFGSDVKSFVEATKKQMGDIGLNMSDLIDGEVNLPDPDKAY